ncbi:MAG: SMC-Scp complex subunit ScpB [Clostridia bacterium]|nr:SMC-Scp complex subunit ScpB [Clostridia bacterium]
MATEILTLPTASLARKTRDRSAEKPAPSNRVQELAHQITAILFACGDGLPVEIFCQKLGVSKKEAETALEFVKGEFSGDCGIHLIKYRNNYQLCTNPAYENEIGLVLNPMRERNLTKAALETLAVIAYKQPVTRLEIDQIRGVGSDYAIQILTQSNLVEIVGRKEVLGRPLLYGTTDNFLKRFGLDDIKHLPSYDELLDKIKLIHEEQANHEVNLYDSNRQ